MSNDDDKLQFTTNAAQGSVFSITPTGQLEFTVVDIWGSTVILLSDQDSHVCDFLNNSKDLLTITRTPVTKPSSSQQVTSMMCTRIFLLLPT
jgi:hypothetical protein